MDRWSGKVQVIPAIVHADLGAPGGRRFVAGDERRRLTAELDADMDVRMVFPGAAG